MTIAMTTAAATEITTKRPPWAPWLGCAAAAVALTLACGLGTPKGSIAGDSKGEECRAELLGALGAFQRDLGLDFEVRDADADAFFTAGAVQKAYARDGARYEVRIGLDASDGGGCTMRMFERRTRQPGRSSMTRGDYGSTALTVCRCE